MMIPLASHHFRLLSVGVGLAVVGCSLFSKQAILHDTLTAEEHVTLGVSYEENEEWDRALTEYKAALEKDGQYLQALVNTGNVQTHLKQYLDAERYYRKVLDEDPEHAMANNNLAWILILQGKRLTEAEDLIGRAISSDPDLLSVYHDTLAHLFLRVGRPKDAMANLEKAERHLSPEDEDMKGHLASTREQIIRAIESFSSPSPSLPASVDTP